jgi:hypothetical protein
MTEGGPIKMSIIAKRRTVGEAGLQWQPTEEQEQAAVIEWRDLMAVQFPALEDLIHIPNGGLRSKSEAVRFKRLGVRPGVSDLFLPEPVGKYHGLWVEMKRQEGGKLSPAQKDWLDRMNRKGYLAVRANGAEEACDIIYKYLTEGE